MSDTPENRPGARRRGGPLGEEAEEAEQSRNSWSGPDDDATQQIQTDDVTQPISTDEATRQISTEERSGAPRRGSGRSGGSSGRDRSSDTQEFEAPPKPPSRRQEGGGGRTRTSGSSKEGREGYSGRGTGGGAGGAGASGGYSTGYNDVLRDREEYLRDIYGGVDWLASFVGFIFTSIFATLLGISSTVFLLEPLEFQESFGNGQLTSTAITGFAIVAAAAFFAFLFGGYISGRMARYDGGRNGAMVLLWTVLVAALLLVLSGVLGEVISGTPIGDLVGEVLSFGSTATELVSGLGVSGALVSGGVVLAALLGGMLGGRFGSRYHREIDYTP